MADRLLARSIYIFELTAAVIGALITGTIVALIMIVSVGC